MLTIIEKFPVKKMVLYGSTAVLIGFAGTYTLLREIFPYASRDNLADANWERNQAANGSVIKPVTEASDDKSTGASKDNALKESGMVVSEAPSVVQPSSNVQPSTAPSSNNGPTAAVPSATPVPAPVVSPADVVPTPAPQPEPQPGSSPTPVVNEPTTPVPPLIENATDSIINLQIQR